MLNLLKVTFQISNKLRTPVNKEIDSEKCIKSITKSLRNMLTRLLAHNSIINTEEQCKSALELLKKGNKGSFYVNSLIKVI
jgi:hypothetical protein